VRWSSRRSSNEVQKPMSNEEAQVVKQLSGMLQYQAASVVSRVLLKNKGGTVTLFAFSKDEGLSEHTAPFDALVQVIEGEAEIGIAPAEAPVGSALETFQVRAGEIITLPANRAHAVKAITDIKMLLTMIRA
jgi:quercetin dioxygenase-like cupin family protein